jgi:hypothetical protein
MKRTLLVLFFLGVALLLGACGRSAITPRPYTPTPVPELNVTRVPGKSVPVLILPTETPPPPAPTVIPPTATSTLAPTVTDTPTRVSVRVRPTATSAGPLSVAVYVVSCRRSPSAAKPGNVTIQISIEPAGGNGDYHYFNQGIEALSKFIDILWEKGSRLTGTVKVVSGDGQSIEKQYDIPIGELECK